MKKATHNNCKVILKRTAVTAIVLLFSGCALPRHTVGLKTVLQNEFGIDRKSVPNYRCTRGAHRGDSVDHMENTLEALKAAHASRKYAFIEFDVQYSKDNVIVVFHDKRLLRLFGKMRTITDAMYEELLDLSRGEIAAYSDAMDILKKKRINIEIKSQGDLDKDMRLADYVISDIKTRKMENDVLISSISGDIIRYVTQEYPYIPTGQIFWLKSSTYLPFGGLTENLYEEMNNTGADYLMLHVTNLRNIRDLLKFKPKGKTIVFWDFNDSMYIVHKDLSDRLWGDSWVKTGFTQLKYNFYAALRRLIPGKKAPRAPTPNITF